MLRRSALKSRARREWEAQRASRAEREPRPMALERVPDYGGGVSGEPVLKECAVEHEGYRRVVATLPCAHCFVRGYSQAAHADEGKGMGIKSDDRTCYPACGPRPGIPGCHWLIGTSGTFAREERRAMEQEYARRTRRAILAAGLWPTDLQIFGGDA